MSTVAIAGQTFTFGVGLYQQADTMLLQAAPTIAAGDFQESTNGAAFNNLDNLPTVTPAGGERVSITLSATETTAAAAGGEIWVKWEDAAGAEWCSGYAVIKVHAAEIDAACTVSAIGANVITAASIATDAITSDELAATATAEIAAANWTYATRTLTQAAATVASALAGGVVTIKRGDSLSASITGLGDISGRTSLWFTVKDNLGDADTASIIQIEETGGLLYLNGAAAGTPANGSITVDDAVAGDITIALQEAETDDLVPAIGLAYDVQVLDAGTVTTLTEGPCHVSGDVTRAIV